MIICKMDIKNKPTEKLEGELKGLQVVCGALIVVLSLLLGITIYGMLTKEDNSVFISLMAVAFSLSAMVPILYLNIKKIKKELASRK